MNPHHRTVVTAFFKDQLSISGPLRIEPVHGGSINTCFKISSGNDIFFCKTNSAVKFPQLFQTEAASLKALAATKCIRTPGIIGCFDAADLQVLVLEWVEPGDRSPSFWSSFGSQLALLHQHSSPAFGWPHANYMGSVPQQNNPAQDWTEFFEHQRIRPLLKLCFDRKLLSHTDLLRFESLMHHLSQWFDPGEKASLVHGDLWSGNFCCSLQGEPVLIDPATYFGHASVDLAMTTLFGGFDKRFYEAYAYHRPLPKDHERLWSACNIYPLLIHLYLFGSSYYAQLMRNIDACS